MIGFSISNDAITYKYIFSLGDITFRQIPQTGDLPSRLSVCLRPGSTHSVVHRCNRLSALQRCVRSHRVWPDGQIKLLFLVFGAAGGAETEREHCESVGRTDGHCYTDRPGVSVKL